jgi:hypothetical protein
MLTKPCLERTAAGLLLVACAVACGDGDGGNSNAGGSAADGGATQNTGGNESTGGTTQNAGGNESTGGANGGNGGSPEDTGGRSTGGRTSSGDAGLPPGPPARLVDLGAAGDFVILAKSGISTVPPSVVEGNIGISPAAASFITGFSLIEDPPLVFSTALQVTGEVYAADYAVPTPATLSRAIGDMELAFTDAAGRAPDFTELGAGDVGGLRLAPGIYKWGTGLLIPTDVTLDGSATDVWIFQIAQDLTISGATSVILSGGALPAHIFWQVAGLVDIGTTAHAEGIVLAQTSISLGTGASINGRLLAQTAVTIDSSAVVEPAP